jgi:hypothetical protein
MEASMKIGTKELVFRLTAAAIGLGLTGAAFGIAVAHSKGAPVVVAQSVTGYESCRKETALDRRQQVNRPLVAAASDQL